MAAMLGSLRSFQSRLLRWYAVHRRDLPWRSTDPRRHLPDPYRVLVSEAMLQQTQVATVVPYFQRFLAAYPTIHALATAPEQEVLRMWQGLGYYSRARNLQAAARVIVERFAGQVPDRVEDLLSLPGVGRYTAGAIASIAYDRPAPIVDGNVIRVLSRLDRIECDVRQDRAALERLWTRAADILPRSRCGDFNSAVMELGATVCLPRGPRCLTCPVRAHCEAAEAGVQELIPPPRPAKPIPLRRRWVFCIERGGQFLIEQRPSKGRWASMWQFITMDAGRSAPQATDIGRAIGLPVRSLQPLGSVSHALTHRRYAFEVYLAPVAGTEATPAVSPRAWASLAALDAYPLPRPHLKIAEVLRARS